MTVDPGARGRRDNGLTAASFLSVGDVDPRVGEHLLDVLYLNGIAAYLQPTVDYDAVTRAVSLPRQPTDRLWADRRRADDARALVAAEATSAGRSPAPPSPATQSPVVRGELEPSESGSGAVDEEAAWAEIVAFFDQESATAVPPWPVSEDTDDARSGEGPDAPRGADAGRLRRHDDVVAAGSTEAQWSEPVEPEDLAPAEQERYIPPPPPPLPRFSKHTVGALLTVAFGVFVLSLGSRLLDMDPDGAFKVGILAIVSGIGYLIWRMRDGPPDGDRPDDGAVV